MSPKSKLVLIDGHALAYRAFHALPVDMKTSQGELTNAVFGFTSMLLNVLRDERPTHIAVTFDKGLTFRHDVYPDYKAHRAKMPDEMSSQMERVREVVATLGIPIFEQEGYEADDLLGTLARQAGEVGVDVLIVTGDSDILQLVDARTRVLTSRWRFSDTVTYDVEGVQRRYGLSPAQLVDLKALEGDKSDNIPGVPGVGEKTALELLRRYGSLEGVYAHLGEVQPRFRSKLEGGRDSAFLSRLLATIVRDAPVRLDLDACRVHSFDRERVMELFRELEFRSLVERLPPPVSPPQAGGTKGGAVAPRQLSMFEEAPPAQPAAPAADYHVVADEAALWRLAAQLASAPALTLDVETTHTDPLQAELVGVSLTDAPGRGYYVPVAAPSGDPQLPLGTALAALSSLLSDSRRPKYGHNIKYDLAVLQQAGAKVEGLAFDTMIAEWLVNPDSKNLGLKNLAWARLKQQMTLISDLIGQGKQQVTMREVPVAQVAPYACADVDMTCRLVSVLEAELKEKQLWPLFTQVEMPLIPVLAAMETVGVRLDSAFLAQMSAELASRLGELEARIQQMVGYSFNINSTQQLSDALFKTLGLPAQGLRRTQSGHFSTAAEVLERLRGRHPVIDLILEQRELAKLRSTYVDALPRLVNPRTGRLHTSYNQTGTVTGRLSSSQPNLQNIPIRTPLGKQVRRAFVAEPGWRLVSADYSQVELRIMAHVSGDEGLLAAFARDEDIHASTAAAIMGVPLAGVTPEMRRVAKAVNFGLAYGQTAYGLAQVTGLTQAEAEDFIKTYFERFPRVREYIDTTKALATRQGYVETLLGRRRYFPELQPGSKAPHEVRQAAERMAINAPIQGCLPYTTRVLTSEGYRRIGELYNSDTSGLKVWTGTSFAHFEVLYRGPCELAELTLENGRVLRCDTRHEVLVVDDDGYKWKKYPQLVAGDKVCLSLPRETEYGSMPEARYDYQPGVHNGRPFSIEGLDEGFFYWLGYYFGDGWTAHRPDDYRWYLAYAIGRSGADDALMARKIAQCTRYFSGLGLKANVRYQSASKAAVTIYSRGFIEFLAGLGVNTHALAETKRLPDFIFSSPLPMRKAFLRGILDADGCTGGNGATTPNLHLCQRGLLEDLWLLFRTTGVEGKIRGPYHYRDGISYRLDLVGGMLQPSLGFSECRAVRIPGVQAPHFLVQALLDTTSPARLASHSHKVLYSRLRHGGTTSVYTLAEMARSGEVSLSVPIYGWSTLKDKRALGVIEDTFTVAVADPSHSFDSEGVISKNTAADIIKIAMIRLHQALRERGLRARMILQVHDELVVEAPDGEVATVVPLMREVMEGAFRLRAPLKADLEVGQNWEET